MKETYNQVIARGLVEAIMKGKVTREKANQILEKYNLVI